MINNYCIYPSPVLQPFVNQYILATSEGKRVTYTSQWPAAYEVVMLFYLQDQPLHNTGFTESALSGKNNYVVGPVTHDNGTVYFDGIYHTFIIEFKPGGFNKLFRIPMTEITNKILCAEDVFGKIVKDFNEVLFNAKNVDEMAGSADQFFLSVLDHHNKMLSIDCIGLLASELNNSNEFQTISRYAGKSNMSLRSFERKFTDQIGISPKQYMQLVRFENALTMKLMHPEKNWTSIAYECGYFDQMHMIRHFNRFTNRNPGAFLSDESTFTRSSINIFESDEPTLALLNISMAKEKFIHVKRR